MAIQLAIPYSTDACLSENKIAAFFVQRKILLYLYVGLCGHRQSYMCSARYSSFYVHRAIPVFVDILFQSNAPEINQLWNIPSDIIKMAQLE
jgi:hypothetical protein